MGKRYTERIILGIDSLNDLPSAAEIGISIYFSYFIDSVACYMQHCWKHDTNYGPFISGILMHDYIFRFVINILV